MAQKIDLPDNGPTDIRPDVYMMFNTFLAIRRDNRGISLQVSLPLTDEEFHKSCTSSRPLTYSVVERFVAALSLKLRACGDHVMATVQPATTRIVSPDFYVRRSYTLLIIFHCIF